MEDLLHQTLIVGTWRNALMSVLLAYVLTQVIGAVYAWSYKGLSYSRSMVLTLVVAGVVSAMLMLAIGNSLARGIGIVGTLALIRFRTNLRDPLDMVFVFSAFGAGIAAGTGSYAVAVLGTVVFLIVVTTLRFSSFGARQQYDGVLRLTLPTGSEADSNLQHALQKSCRSFALITLRDVAQGREQERAYQISLRDAALETDLVSAVASIPGATGVTVALQEATVEL